MYLVDNDCSTNFFLRMSFSSWSLSTSIDRDWFSFVSELSSFFFLARTYVIKTYHIHVHVQAHTKTIYRLDTSTYMYRLYTEVKVSMGFINQVTIVARLINAIETVPRCITHFYHAKHY